MRRSVMVLAALALVHPSGPAQGKTRGDKALGKQVQRVANRFVSALRRTRALKGFMSKKVTVTYSTSDRAEGTFKGKVVVDGAKVDSPVRVPGMTGGYAWVLEKKIKPRPKTVELRVGKAAYDILEEIRGLGRKNRIVVDKKDLTFYIGGASESMTFHFRLEPDKKLRIHKLGYSNDDPG